MTTADVGCAALSSDSLPPSWGDDRWRGAVMDNITKEVDGDTELAQ
jgi:hypothetical protein